MDLNAVMVCYDISNRKSFENLGKWVKEIKDNYDHMYMMVVGLKGDKKSKRVVKERDVAQFVRNYRMTFKECSSKTGDNVKEIAFELASSLAR